MADDELGPRITDPKALRALAHPTRLAIVDQFALEPTLTATRCAEVTGESVASCSYHLGMLAKYGFVGEAEGGQGREKPWRLLRRRQVWSSEGLDVQGEPAVEALTDALVDRNADQLKIALRRLGREPQEWRETPGISTATAYLTADEAATLRDELHALALRYSDRVEDRQLRPAGSRPVRLFLARWLAGPVEEEA